jgi:hypothetical protein
MSTYFSQSELKSYGTVSRWCAECGARIEGDPYQMTFSGVCASFGSVSFCSKKCWDASEMYNTDNWPPSPKAPEGW